MGGNRAASRCWDVLVRVRTQTPLNLGYGVAETHRYPANTGSFSPSIPHHHTRGKAFQINTWSTRHALVIFNSAHGIALTHIERVATRALIEWWGNCLSRMGMRPELGKSLSSLQGHVTFQVRRNKAHDGDACGVSEMKGRRQRTRQRDFKFALSA